jgi:superfamily II DNA helicase RecQ
MYVLHDIYIKHEDLSAQIDFIVITSKINFIIECKNLYGNISVNNRSEFKRSSTYNRRTIKEGIYSPITQNQRHIEILKQKRIAQVNNKIQRAIFTKIYDNYNKSIVVLANPKTVFDCKYAKKEIKNQIIRCDQLIDYIKNELKNSKEASSSNKDMKLLATNLLKLHESNNIDYYKKYKEHIKETDNYVINKVESVTEYTDKGTIEANLSNNEYLITELKNYRLEQSRKENVKAYYIFTNKMLDALIENKPKTLVELKNISGFGDVKIERYGKDIIKIINIS